jgi:hypothetical protein
MRVAIAVSTLAATLALGASAAGASRNGAGIVFGTGWEHYVLSGDRPAHFIPVTAAPTTPATLVWRHEVAGNLALTFGAVTPGTLIHVAFSETSEYLGVDGTSDWSRTYTTDDHEPVTGENWVDLPGCQAPGVCADGYRAFRFARVFVERGSARIVGAAVRLSQRVGTPRGWFLSSDDLLNRIWYSSAYTAQLMELPNDPAVLATGCSIPGGPTLEMIVDGAKRDRCPWLADQAVTEPTLFLTGGDATAAENTLSLFANAQRADGYIPASPLESSSSVVFDYPAYWVLAVDDLLLYRGARTQIAAYWPALVRVLDDWYPTFSDARGLLEDRFPPADYAYIPRFGPLVAYYNALYARALEAGAGVADALGQADAVARWRSRVQSLATAFGPAFWDASAGAFEDSPSGPPVHPQDGNALAILAGLASPAQAASAIGYLDRATSLPWGNAIADNDSWSTPDWVADPSQQVYPFVSYFDVAARFAAGSDSSALHELRRTWGWMLRAPGTTWEAIGGSGTIDGFERAATSMAHGWSTGAAPALTNYVLGVVPTGPGFSTFDAIPHPGDLAWAQGGVPTPAGTITFGWKRIRGGFLLRLDAPGKLVARVGAPAGSNARVLVDGRQVAATTAGADTVATVRGPHTVEVLGG